MIFERLYKYYPLSIGQFRRFSGFSLIELIAVLLLLGILSVFALGRLASPDQFAVKGFFDDTVTAVRFAQKLAVSTGCDVQVNITSAGYQLRRSSTCVADDYGTVTGVVVDNPANRSNPYQNLTSGFTIAPATSIVFDARGLPESGSNVTYTVSGAGSALDFTVTGQTGLVNVH